MIIQLPVSSDPAQTFTVQLGAAKYMFNVRWSERAAVWVADLYREADAVALLVGVPLLIGTDLLQPHNLSMGHLIVYDETGQSRDAGADDLGTRVNVYWISDDEEVPE